MGWFGHSAVEVAGGPVHARFVPARGTRLRLSWDPFLVPYLGLWFDHCAFSREPVVAVEPATGWRDRLDLAAADGTVSWATPEAPLEWWIDVEVVDGVRRTVGECSP
jgi:hypothetical protein